MTPRPLRSLAAPPEVLARPLANAPRRAYAAAVRRAHLGRSALVDAQLRRLAAEVLGVGDARHRVAMREVERLLLAKDEARWLAGLPSKGVAWSWSRGFPEGVTLDAARFLALAPALFARAPVLHAALRSAAGEVGRLADSPWLARLCSLDLRNNGLGDDDVATLAASPHAASLRWLDLSFNRVGARGLDALAASPHLAGLQWLGFALNAAPDPTPRVCEDHGQPVHVAHSGEGAALTQRYGPKRWLEPPLHLATVVPPAWTYAYEDPLDPSVQGPDDGRRLTARAAPCRCSSAP